MDDLRKNLPLIALGVVTLVLIGAAIFLGVQLQSTPTQTPDDTTTDGDVFTRVCGNGIIETGEQCDDGNTVTGDGCSAVCISEFEESDPICGDGKLSQFEQCDDGNNTDGDGCSAVCRVEAVNTGGGLDCSVNTTETITVTLSSPAGSCDFPTRRNDGNVAGINTVTQTVQSSNVCSFNSVSATGNDGSIIYDDAFAITINNAILLASHSPLYDPFPNDGVLKIWNGFATIDQLRLRTRSGSNNHPPRCLGESSCTIPASQERGQFSLDISANAASTLAQYLYDATQYNISIQAVGDNDRSIDCRVSELTLTLEVETKPDGCSCDFVDSQCGNGTLELGEQCDDGNLENGDTCTRSCRFPLPDTALFDENNRYLLVGALLLIGALLVNRSTFLIDWTENLIVKLSTPQPKHPKKKSNHNYEKQVEEKLRDRLKN